MSEAVDALILGGGPAGLAVALGIARQLHTGIVFNTSKFRNSGVQHMHNVAGFDHEDPAEFRAKTRNDILKRYDTISFHDAGVASVKKLDNGRFVAVDDAGVVYEGRKVVVASGIRDIMADLPGYSELYGKAIHGRDGEPHICSAIARMANRLAGSVNIYTNGNADFGAEIRMLLKSTKKFHVENRKIKSLAKDPGAEGEGGILVTLEDGVVIKEGFIAHVPESELNGPFAKDLELEIAPQGHINAIPPFFNTNVAGVFAAGDCATILKSVSMATAMGSFVDGGLAHALQAEDDVEE
ncbi:FAD/NAD(P)-binding domain-containing protein [Xylariaceae sp. FL0255]|nr:FAD/NAD(P)-binding domain-containing protein [Xylariaceae sp. FL0255]